MAHFRSNGIFEHGSERRLHALSTEIECTQNLRLAATRDGLRLEPILVKWSLSSKAPRFLLSRYAAMRRGVSLLVVAPCEFAAFGNLAKAGGWLKLETSRRVAHTGRILKGKILPSCRSSRQCKSELVINLKTAKALGLTMPARRARMKRREFFALLGGMIAACGARAAIEQGSTTSGSEGA